MRLPIAFVLLLCLAGNPVLCQVTDYFSTFKNSSNKHARLQYDNDFFTKSDEYYTQGITMDIASPFFSKSPLNVLLVKTGKSVYAYGIALNHFVYTPTSIASDYILDGDRPFSGNISISNFLTSADSVHHQLITSAITIGIIGPAAGAKQMQQTIHRWLDNPQPHGWQYQVQNDLLLTYQVNFEKELLAISSGFLVNVAAEIKAGTHTDKLKAGINFMAGHFNDPYRPVSGTTNNLKKVSYYLYGQVQPGFTAYDATLQGGLFNRTSPYTIKASQLNRVTLQADYGIVVSFRKINLEYSQSILTKEFSTGHYHRWGGVRMGLNF